ncbi:MAG: amidohydrolase [Lachnospiraceae bacterium]|nr:amidohydrolase [Lachnospiraceae bacterium]MDD7025403.1 amidohydrolase [Oscillospiraceae bacterium]MDY5541568.1 amidohydrolase [Lachnospiraceae bacterium]
MKRLLKHAMVVTMNERGEVFTRGNVLTEDDRIIQVGNFETDEASCDEVLDCEGKILLPGFVNTHVHTSQQLARGLADDVDLLTWLHDRIWPYESSMTEEDSYISTLLCALEQIKCGVTSIAEPGGQFVSGMARGIAEAGIRGKLAKSVMDCGEGLPASWQHTAREELDAQEENLKRFHNSADGRIKVWFGIRTIFNATDELLLKTKELADKYGVGIHMHVAEAKSEVDYLKEKIGVSTVTHLRDLGILDKNFLAVHTVWLTDEEVEMFRDHQVKVSHNPASAMRVLGFAKVPRMLKEGICVSIGTDGAPTNNRMDMVDELWVTSLIHKGWRLDPTVVKAQEILRMATINGARAVLEGDSTGSLEAGKKADLIVINPDSVCMQPMHDPIANLVTSMHSCNVESTMCDGKWLMKDRKVLTIDEEALLAEAKERASAIRVRAGIQMPSRFLMV